jgi:hypothetical protein
MTCCRERASATRNMLFLDFQLIANVALYALGRCIPAVADATFVDN